MTGSLELDEALFWSDWKTAKPPVTSYFKDGEPFELRPKPLGRISGFDIDQVLLRTMSAHRIWWASSKYGRYQAEQAMPNDFTDMEGPMTLNIIVHLDDGGTVEFSTEAKELQYIGPEIAHALVERGIEVYERLEVVVEKAGATN